LGFHQKGGKEIGRKGVFSEGRGAEHHFSRKGKWMMPRKKGRISRYRSREKEHSLWERRECGSRQNRGIGDSIREGSLITQFLSGTKEKVILRRGKIGRKRPLVLNGKKAVWG